MQHSVPAGIALFLLLLFCVVICQVESYPQMPSYSAAGGLKLVNNENNELLRLKRAATANQVCYNNCLRESGYAKPQTSQTLELTCQGMCDFQNADQ